MKSNAYLCNLMHIYEVHSAYLQICSIFSFFNSIFIC